MSKNEFAAMKDEVQRGFDFLATIRQTGNVYLNLKPVFDRLRAELTEEESLQQQSVGQNSMDISAVYTSPSAPSSRDYESIVLGIHKAIYEESFICIVERPSSVPGFAAPVRELPPHQLPDGWNSNPNSYSLMYKHKQKPGKQFMLTCTILMDGSILNAIVTEKGGLSLGTELEVEEFRDPLVTKENKEAALKAHVQSLVWQLIPALKTSATAVTNQSTAGSNSATASSSLSLRAPIIPTPAAAATPTPYNPYNDPRYDPRGDRGDGGGFIPTPMVPPVGGPGGYGGVPGFQPGYQPGNQPHFPGVGGGDLNPSFPGVIPHPRGDNGQGSLVGPSHPLFNIPDYNNDPNNDPNYYDPTAPPGWPVGMPRPRFDAFMPVPGPNGPNFGGQNLQVPGRGGRGGRGGQRGYPGEPNPDHFIPPGDGDRYI